MSEKIERFGSSFAPGDKVMQTENDYDREVFNGDLGRIKRIDETEGLLIAEFNGREVEYPFGELDTLVPAYAMTIHKSQGSEYPAVVITIATQHYTMLARNLFYTAVTRGKRLVECGTILHGNDCYASARLSSDGAKSISTRAPLGSWKKSCHTPAACPPSGSRRRS
jgi:UvrD-like helicase C-terminal domain/ATP-dependent RecD-like DNA helicase SH3 domain